MACLPLKNDPWLLDGPRITFLVPWLKWIPQTHSFTVVYQGRIWKDWHKVLGTTDTFHLLPLNTGHLNDYHQELLDNMYMSKIKVIHVVMVSYLDGCTFLLCMSRCLFFPLGLTSYTEDHYTFTLGSHSFTLKPIPLGDHTPVPALLFTSWVG